MQVVKLGARPWLPPAASLIVRFGFWHWAKTILVPAYAAKVVAEKRSVGNHSDLYPTLAGCPRIAFARDPTAREAFWVPTLCFLRRAMTKAPLRAKSGNGFSSARLLRKSLYIASWLFLF